MWTYSKEPMRRSMLATSIRLWRLCNRMLSGRTEWKAESFMAIRESVNTGRGNGACSIRTWSLSVSTWKRTGRIAVSVHQIIRERSGKMLLDRTVDARVFVRRGPHSQHGDPRVSLSATTSAMIPSLRNQFNAAFTPEKYQTFLRRIDDACGTHVQFRLSETPCFFPKSLLERMAEDGKALIRQLVETADYRARSDASIPARVPSSERTAAPDVCAGRFWPGPGCRGELQPKLVELQAFPSLYAYQLTLAQSYIDVFELNRFEGGEGLRFLLGGLDEKSYRELLRRAIVGNHDPENVILMEIHPRATKNFAGFSADARRCLA